MKKNILTLLFCFAFCLFQLAIIAQDRFIIIEQSLNELVQESPGLNEKVELSVSNVGVQEFIRGLAIAHNLNISVDPGLRGSVVNNFSNVSVSEVLLFLCKQHDLDIEFIGSIMYFSKHIAPKPEPAVYVPKKVKIHYDAKTDFLSIDFRKDSLEIVAREITKISFKNVVLAPDLEGKLVSVFIQNRPFDNTLDKMAFANNLVITKTEDNFYLIEKKETASIRTTGRRPITKRIGRKGGGQLDIKVVDGEFLNVNAFDVPIADVIATVSSELFVNYFLFSEPKGNTTLFIENATYEEFLNYLLNGSNFTFKKQENVYLIGERKLEGLRTTEIVQLQHRTVESLIKYIPPELKQDVNIQEFTDLNSLILSGSHPKINEIKQFLKDIDKIVPVILIEVLIVDAKKFSFIKTGINIGTGTPPNSTQSILPGLDYTFSTQTINNLINSFNGFGIFNLGKVTPNFYISLSALEDAGIIEISSTPKLSTLNGKEATLSIGETEYYLETTNNVIGTQNPQNIITQSYKSLSADLTITIKPIVSGDDQVTLDISVKQSNFKEKQAEFAPRGQETKSFKSVIRVKNEEMVLLGGLESQTRTNTGTGTPVLSRIPIIKWFFSSKTRNKDNRKLNIFIKPTIIY